MMANTSGYHVWCFSLIASAAIGLVGLMPIMFVSYLKSNVESSNRTLKLMLSFSVGGLLGDVFLHLLPEAWNLVSRSSSRSFHDMHLTLGFWVVSGISTFVAIEIIFASTVINTKNKENSAHHSPEVKHINGFLEKPFIKEKVDFKQESSLNIDNHSSIDVTGYLSLFANSVDNFTHGLAIAASFLAGTKIGILTTLAIIVHEVPHEFGDFAILIKSGFSKWRAVQAQIITAGVCMIGSLVVLMAESHDSIGTTTSWVLPYSAGCFLYIAMSSILPDLQQEENPRESIKQLICIACGVVIMGLVNRIELDDLIVIPYI